MHICIRTYIYYPLRPEKQLQHQNQLPPTTQQLDLLVSGRLGHDQVAASCTSGVQRRRASHPMASTA